MSDMTTRPETASPQHAQVLDKIRTRAAALAPAGLLARFRAAVGEMEAALDGVTGPDARRRPPGGGWSIAQVVDHLAQTTIRSADELRQVLAGRRPPLPPVYEALTSGAAAWVPWEALVAGLQSANAELEALVAGAVAAETPAPGRPTVLSVLVAIHTAPDGAVTQEPFEAELDWKEYVLVQRLHLLDHRNQVKQIRAALEADPR